ncbi:hypothetical protein N0V91_004879 [Didymella pomorum]|uniref:Uncharacterized protein n=1 Tax=Didymella pomorum TaxID=749634 RepID=A0A9W9D7R7_9PLEO|nr:hypothetical protein N0V91_004879 [Didymella pomorum]
MTILNLDYPVAPLLYQGNGQSLDKYALSFKVPGDSIDSLLVVDKNTAPTNYANFVTEHIVELQTVKLFLEHAAAKDKALVPFLQTFWKQSLNAQDVSKRPNQPDKGVGFPLQANLNDLVFQALGSDSNRKDFVLCDKTINAYKARIWKKTAPLQAGDLNTLVANGVRGSLPTNEYFTVLRNAIGVFKNANVPSVKQRMQRSIKNVETELKNLKHYKQTVDLAPVWITFMKEHLESVTTTAQKFLSEQINNAERKTSTEIARLKQLSTQLKALESNKLKRNAHKKKQAALEKNLGTKIDALEKKLQSEVTKIKTLTTAKTLVLSKLRAVPKNKPAEKKRWQAQNKTKKAQLSAAKKQHRRTQIELGDAERAWAVLYSAGVDGVMKSLDLDKKRLAMYKTEVAKMNMPPLA